MIFFVSCSEDKKQDSVKAKKKVILVQPFSDISQKDVEYVTVEIKKIYPEIKILKPIDFPQNAYYKPRNRYRADSIIKHLSFLTKDGFITLGLTSKDISVTKGKNPDFGIMGLGYKPGKACVASKFRLSKNNTKEQFFKVAIHELGHTQGLNHCPEKSCYMRDAEGGNPTDEEKDFCNKCKKHLRTKNWEI